jgi:hypothetical protein
MISRYLMICVLMSAAATFFPSDLMAQGQNKCAVQQKGKQCTWDNRASAALQDQGALCSICSGRAETRPALRPSRDVAA